MLKRGLEVGAQAMTAEACLYVEIQRVEMPYLAHQLNCNAGRTKLERPWHAVPAEQKRELIWGLLSDDIPLSTGQLQKTDGFFETEAASLLQGSLRGCAPCSSSVLGYSPSCSELLGCVLPTFTSVHQWGQSCRMGLLVCEATK